MKKPQHRDSSPLRAVCAGILFITATTSAGAQDYPAICSILGNAMKFSIVATEQLQSREYFAPPSGYPLPHPVSNAVCAPNVRAGRVAEWLGDMVATEPIGTAIKFGILTTRIGGRLYCDPDSDGYATYPCNGQRFYYGSVITGGGTISALHNLMPYQTTIDTTGSHPQVADCNDAIVRLNVASTALAQGLMPGEPPSAVRPIIHLGDVAVEREATYEFPYVAPNDLTIYEVHNLTIQGGKRYPGYAYFYVGEGGTVSIDNGVVVNVTGRLKIGRNGVIDASSGLVNLVGPGPALSMIRAFPGAAILAPERNIRIRALGGGDEYYFFGGSHIFGRKVKMMGSAAFGTYWGGLGPEDCGFPGLF